MISWNLPGVSEIDHENIPARITGVPAEIKTKHLRIIL
jgi:hypothetical protein